MAGPVELREEIAPAGPFRLPRAGLDGLVRRRGGVLERLLHDGEQQPVLVRVAQPAPDRVLIGARAASEGTARHGIARSVVRCDAGRGCAWHAGQIRSRRWCWPSASS